MSTIIPFRTGFKFDSCSASRYNSHFPLLVNGYGSEDPNDPMIMCQKLTDKGGLGGLNVFLCKVICVNRVLHSLSSQSALHHSIDTSIVAYIDCSKMVIW